VLIQSAPIHDLLGSSFKCWLYSQTRRQRPSKNICLVRLLAREPNVCVNPLLWRLGAAETASGNSIPRSCYIYFINFEIQPHPPFWVHLPWRQLCERQRPRANFHSERNGPMCVRCVPTMFSLRHDVSFLRISTHLSREAYHTSWSIYSVWERERRGNGGRMCGVCEWIAFYLESPEPESYTEGV